MRFWYIDNTIRNLVTKCQEAGWQRRTEERLDEQDKSEADKGKYKKQNDRDELRFEGTKRLMMKKENENTKQRKN